jgi:hypothetical protein
MKKIITNTIKVLKFMSVLAFVGFIGSCDKTDETTIWDDSAAATLTSISPSSALIGKEVTIAGKYFSSKADNAVSFNGINAEITSANISEIIAIMPEGSTDGNITVTSDGLVSNGLPYTVMQPIIPTISTLDPITGKIGQTVIITGTDFSTTPMENEVRFNGVQATVTESTATTITTTVPAGACTGIVTVTRDEESNGVLFTVTVSYTVTATIATDEDDGEEGALNGAMALESSDLELGEYDTWTQDGIEQGVQTVGVRFIDLDIPAGVNILSASIQFECDNTGADPAEMTIYGEDNGNALVFTNVPYNITSRSRTTENTVWDIPEWVNKGDAGPAQQTPSLVNIVQTIVNRGDWVSGNSMVFILKPSGTTVDETSSSGGREAEADPGDDAAVLTIVYDMDL